MTRGERLVGRYLLTASGGRIEMVTNELPRDLCSCLNETGLVTARRTLN